MLATSNESIKILSTSPTDCRKTRKMFTISSRRARIYALNIFMIYLNFGKVRKDNLPDTDTPSCSCINARPSDINARWRRLIEHAGDIIFGAHAVAGKSNFQFRTQVRALAPSRLRFNLLIRGDLDCSSAPLPEMREIHWYSAHFAPSVRLAFILASIVVHFKFVGDLVASFSALSCPAAPFRLPSITHSRELAPARSRHQQTCSGADHSKHFEALDFSTETLLKALEATQADRD